MIEDKPLEHWRHAIAVDLDSVFLGCKHGVRAIKKSTAKGGPDGSIINVSSILGLVGQPARPTTTPAKGGVRLLTKSAALECAQALHRIRVNSVHPGYVRTPMVQSVIDKGEIGGMQMGANGVVEMLTMLHPIGRLGAPEDIGNGIVFLASDESAFMTGAELRHRRRLHDALAASGRTGARGRAQPRRRGRRSPAQRRAPGQEAPTAPPASAQR